MTRRILLAGEPGALREQLRSCLDDAFDVDIEEVSDALDAVKLLPNRTYDLMLVLAAGVEAPGLDLVRFVRSHALHGRVPVLFAGGSTEDRQAALAAGARLIPAVAVEADVQRAVKEALSLG